MTHSHHTRKYTFWGHHRLTFLSALALCGLVLAGDFPAAGQAEVAPVPGPSDVFAEIGLAWQFGDEQALANLVHRDGLRVRRGRGDGRTTHYSPSQAYYYFKNLFQSNPTVSFTFERRQQNTAGERTRAMTLWTHRENDSSQEQEEKLVLVLSSDKGLWRLSEIQTISTN